ncbi:MAG: site-2 protease family protein [Firmicutes bacterium]|nr:site-2 protease family protein [Bacillota bacterium]
MPLGAIDVSGFLELLLSLPIILFALSAHEFFHAYVSFRLGDPTAARAGRLTLLPWVHLDPLGTLMLILSYLSGYAFGWARPVPIDPSYYRNPARGVLLVSAAGPLANLFLAGLFGLCVRLPWFLQAPWVVQEFILAGVTINLGLFLFNLIPVPPLDGAGILGYFLRGRLRVAHRRMREIGLVLLVVIIVTGGLVYPLRFLFYLLTGYYLP